MRAVLSFGVSQSVGQVVKSLRASHPEWRTPCLQNNVTCRRVGVCITQLYNDPNPTYVLREIVLNTSRHEDACVDFFLSQGHLAAPSEGRGGGHHKPRAAEGQEPPTPDRGASTRAFKERFLSNAIEGTLPTVICQEFPVNY